MKWIALPDPEVVAGETLNMRWQPVKLVPEPAMRSDLRH
jgi:hypothetical protein